MTKFLKTIADVETAAEEIRRRGWPLNQWNEFKNWDMLWLDMRDGNILDVGCVTSPTLEVAAFLKLRGEHHGVDISDGDSVAGWKIPENTTFKKAGAEQLPYNHSMFDYVTCLSVIEHGVDLDKFSKELARVLRHGGRFLITFDFWPYPKVSGVLDWSDLMGFREMLTRRGLVLEPMDTTLGEKVIDGRYTFGALRGVKPWPPS